MAQAAATKAALAVVGIVGVAAVTGPYFIGRQVEGSFRDSIASLGTQSPYPIRISRYERGLYAAEAETVIEIPLPPEPHQHGDDEHAQAAPKTMSLRLHHVISHGPRLDGLLRSARMVTTPVFDTETAAALQPLFGDAPLFTLITDVGFGGSVSGSLRSPAVDSSKAGGDNAGPPTRLKWAGIDSNYSLAGGHLLFRLDAPGLDLSGDAATAGTIGPIVISADLRQIEHGPLWIGNSALSVASMAFKAGDTGLRLDQLEILSDTREEAGLMNSGVQFTAAKIEASDLKLDQLRLHLALDHVNAVAASELSQAMNRYQQEHGKDPAAADPAAMAAALKPALGKLAAGHPEFRIDELSFTSPEGALKVDGLLRYIGDDKLEDFSPLTDVEGKLQIDAPLSTLNLLLSQKLRSDMAQSAGVRPEEVPPEVIASMLASTRDGLVKQGLLNVDGDRGSSRIAFQAGVLTINGKALGAPAP